MIIFKWLDRQIRRIKRKQRLGEKFTSNLTWRRFSTEQLLKLNHGIDFNNVDKIYEIGWCNGKDKYLGILKFLIKYKALNAIRYLDNTIEDGQDEMGFIPRGEYLKTYLWAMKDGRIFVQLVKGSFDTKEEEVEFEQDIKLINFKNINKRKLIYPI